MQATWRFGDRGSAEKYPLPVSVAQPWRGADGVVGASIPIPPCPAQHLIVPSVSIPGKAPGFQCALQVGDNLWPLQPVACPPPGSEQPSDKAGGAHHEPENQGEDRTSHMRPSDAVGDTHPESENRRGDRTSHMRPSDAVGDTHPESENRRGDRTSHMRSSGTVGGAHPDSTRVEASSLFTARSDNEDVSAHIDCFHTESDLPESRLLVRLAQPEPPERFLITLSIRPLRIDPNIPANTHIVLAQPPPTSQMLGPKPIRRRICSPTALTMVLRAAQPAITWRSAVDACFDGRFYGSWPLAIRCAGLHGRLGAVEAVTSWEPILRVLRSGSPVVASIRFDRNALPGAPLAETQGHLVAVYGIDGNEVLVCDPAAPDNASVPRSYDLGAFTNAWLRHRGAAYLLAPG